MPLPSLFERSQSPCIGCKNQFEDKEYCSEHCEKLREWQPDRDKVAMQGDGQEFIIDRAIILTKKCDCGEQLIFQEGVVFCCECLELFVRVNIEDTPKVIVDLRDFGFEFDQIAEILSLTELWVRRKWMETTGEKIEPKPQPNQKVDMEKLVKWKEQGKSSHWIASQFDTSARYIRKVYKKWREKNEREN